MLTCKQLPREKSGFFKLLGVYFPCVYDVKFLMSSCKNLKGGLQEVSDMLQVERIGPQHQAGSDSLLTGRLFFKLRQTFFDGKIDDTKFLNVLYGLSPGNTLMNESSASSGMLMNPLDIKPEGATVIERAAVPTS